MEKNWSFKFFKILLRGQKINTNLIDKKIMQLVKNAFTFAEKSNFPSKNFNEWYLCEK